jgi:5-(carboxyamino)imidazole ribonucleotide synthase
MTPDKPLLPGATIGVMGGGQLGRMFAIAARRMGYRVHTFSPAKDGPAAQLSDCATAASYDDEEAVMQFARSIDVLTFEFENIPAATIEWAACAQPLVRPRGEVLLIAQNRLREKEFLFGAGFPVARFRRVASAPDLTGAVAAIGRPAILKGAAFGYDGKGQQRIDPGTDLAEIWAGRTNEVCVLEQVIDSKRRFPCSSRAVEPARRPSFRCAKTFIAITSSTSPLHRRGSSAGWRRQRANWRCAVAVSLDLVGLLAVEMFVSHEGELIINELAPRPHNSGHWTIEGCATSQFEQHVRAVCGLPLGATGQLRAAAMVNLLGDLWSGGEPNWREALRIPGARLHLYGKDEPRPRRKMGHLTVTAPRIEDARERAIRARACLTSPAARYTTEVIQTRTLAERDWAVSEAVALLRAGEAVALPTETVYGLAADATNPAAIEKIFEAKERPRFDPLIVHFAAC